MKRIIDILRFIFISVEMLTVGLVLLAAAFLPVVLSSIGEAFNSDKDLSKYLPTISIGLVAVAAKFGWMVLFPTPKPKKPLTGWSSYGMLRDRVVASWLLSVLSAFASLFPWVFSGKVSPSLVGAFAVESVAVPLVVVANLILAAVNMKEIVEDADV